MFIKNYHVPIRVSATVVRLLEWLIIAAVLTLWSSLPAHADRIKDLATFSGVRTNQLLGYGLVVGLDGSGDTTTQAPFTAQSVNSMLSQLGIQLPPGISPQLRNSAAVMVTAQLPAFSQVGQAIDVTVSSIGNAKSLRGGTLLLTPLRGADGQIYAIAQGNLVVVGAGASGGGSRVQINHLNAGRVPGGATVERLVPNASLDAKHVTLELNQTDFSTARRISEAINRKYASSAATPPAMAVDARSVRVGLPEAQAERVAFLADLENIEVAMAQPAARVIVNSRTGSVVMNQSVSIGPCAIAHGNLSVSISTTPVISQPNALGQGSTVVAEKTDISIRQESGALVMVEGTKLADVVKALNGIGASAQDLIAILQSMRAAGALKAELEII